MVVFGFFGCAGFLLVDEVFDEAERVDDDVENTDKNEQKNVGEGL